MVPCVTLPIISIERFTKVTEDEAFASPSIGSRFQSLGIQADGRRGAGDQAGNPTPAEASSMTDLMSQKFNIP